MMKSLDNLLNKITMYRLVAYVLMLQLAVAVALSFVGALPYNPVSIVLTTLLLVGIAWLTNFIFAAAFHAPRFDDSAYITGLILALILLPIRSSADYGFIFWAPVLAMALKYIFAYRQQHIFNPAALAVALTAYTIHASASWWVGTLAMLPVAVVGGFLIVRKIRRWDTVIPFLMTAIVITSIFGLQRGTSVLTTLNISFLSTPLVFFATIMLTEPQTMPPTHKLRLLYGVLVGLLFAPQVHLGNQYSTPELALLVGNVIFFLFVRRERYVLRLREKVRKAPGIIDFIFDGPRFAFQPGQYMEWTLPNAKSDSRGTRRYFTIASAPSEAGIRLGVKFYPKPSSFKIALAALRPGELIVAGQRDGDFTLPRRSSTPIVFIAGGIGVTPFRSIIMELLAKQERRTITLFYACSAVPDFVYHEMLDQAEARLGIKTVYVLGDNKNVPAQWHGKVGSITPDMINTEVSDWQQRLFYISGPNAMVKHYEAVLAQLGIPRNRIKTDYFPGFA